jgi:hypothetical protein
LISRPSSIRLSLRAVAAWLFATTAIVYVESSPLGVLACAVLFLLVLFLDHRNGLLLAVVFLLSTLALEAAVRLVSDSGLTSYYRPHELLANNRDRNYRKNERLRFSSPHGDLLATDPFLDETIAQPREIEFITDSLGFRNSRDYAEDKLILIGDSFVVGTGNSQQDTLTEILNNRFGVSAYNMAFPDGPHGYAARISEARMRFPSHACVAVVMFEGNDFRDIAPGDLAVRDRVPGPIQSFVRTYFYLVKGSSELSRLVYGLKARAREILFKRQPEGKTAKRNVDRPKSFVHAVGGFDMAFLTGYSDVVRRPVYSDHGYLLTLFSAAKPDHIFFVPDKYRIYSALLDDEPLDALPHAQWQHLATVAEQIGVGVSDLTPILLFESRRSLGNGITTFWRDDTHWNRYGMLPAAQAIVMDLGRSAIGRCRDSVPTARHGSIPHISTTD